jgi:serine/threonine-protein kinase
MGLGTLLAHRITDVASPPAHDTVVNSVQEQAFEKEHKDSTTVPLANPPESILQGQDSMVLRLVTGGKITFPGSFGKEGGKSVDVNPFYMDETKVTNIQYVEFLNRVLSRTKIEKGIVRGDGNIWLHLGEVTSGCDPIGLKEGRFYVKEPAHASCPVLRVTAHGASAYARFYGKRLPTQAEWLRAMGAADTPKTTLLKSGSESYGWMKDDGQCPLPGQTDSSAATDDQTPPVCSPVSLFKANDLGVKGLNVGGEWGTANSGLSLLDGEAGYMVLGASTSNAEGKNSTPSAVKRHPWEAFEEVGFRGVVDATSKRP